MYDINVLLLEPYSTLYNYKKYTCTEAHGRLTEVFYTEVRKYESTSVALSTFVRKYESTSVALRKYESTEVRCTSVPSESLEKWGFWA